MTKEQAYERLELPVGTDLHIVRQKFQQMHNSFQVQIDGAVREDMRQMLQARLGELEEAFKLLNGGEGADDSSYLPRTEKTFEQNRTEEAKTQTTPLTLQQALALFGLTEHQDVAQIEQHIASHISNLQQQLSTSPLQTVKDAYQMEIDKAASAKKVISEWRDKRKEEESQKKEPQQQAETAFVAIDEESNKNIKRWNDFIFILFLSSIALLFLELLLNTRIELLFVYAIGVIMMSAIILNHYAPMLVPPALRKDYFSGKGVWKGLFFLMLIVLGLGVLTGLFKFSGLMSIANSTLRIVCWMIYLLIMGSGVILGLINPRIIFFKNRGDVLKALIAMLIAHLFICLVIGMLL